MLGLSNLQMGIAAALAIACAVLFGLWKYESSQNKALQSAIEEQNQQIATLTDSNRSLNQTITELREAQERADRAVAEDKSKATARTVTTTRRIEVIRNDTAKDDAPPACVLVRALDLLRTRPAPSGSPGPGRTSLNPGCAVDVPRQPGAP